MNKLKTYTDYYKKSSRVPGSLADEDDHDELGSVDIKKKPFAKKDTMGSAVTDTEESKLRKDALKRRLKLLESKKSGVKAKPGVRLRRQ